MQTENFESSEQHFAPRRRSRAKTGLRLATGLIGVPPLRVHRRHNGRTKTFSLVKPCANSFETDNATGKKKKKKGGFFKKIAKGIKNVTMASALIPALLPFVPVMFLALKKKGLRPPKNPVKLAHMFYDNIVKKTQSKFEQVHFEHYAADDHILPIAAIVPPIIKFIKHAVDKRKAKKAQSAEEVAVSDVAAPIIDKISDKAASVGITAESLGNGSNEKIPSDIGDEKVSGSIGGIKMDKKTMLIAGGVVAVVVAFFVLKK